MKLWKYDGSGEDERFRAATASDVNAWLDAAPEEVRDAVFVQHGHCTCSQRDEWRDRATTAERERDEARVELAGLQSLADRLRRDVSAWESVRWMRDARLSLIESGWTPPAAIAEPEPALAPGSRWVGDSIEDREGRFISLTSVGASPDVVFAAQASYTSRSLIDVRALLHRHDRGQR